MFLSTHRHGVDNELDGSDEWMSNVRLLRHVRGRLDLNAPWRVYLSVHSQQAFDHGKELYASDKTHSV